MGFSGSAIAAATAIIFSVATLAQNMVDPLAKAAYFTTVTEEGEYVAAFNFVQNGDFYLHMSAPSENSWVGVGIGDSMVNALHIIAYKAENGTGVTTSARFSGSHSEPVHIEDAPVVKIFSDLYGPKSNVAVPGGIMISHTVCKNCTQYLPYDLDYSNTAQPFIFAIGPKKGLNSDSLEANLRRHAVYGHFTLDMTKATSPLDFPERGPDYGRVPAPNDVGNPDEDSGGFLIQYGTLVDDHTDSDPVPVAHAVLMCVPFIVIFPLGGLILRLMKNVLYHSVAQSVGMIFVIAGFGTGIYISHEYNRSRDFQSAHQILGLIVFAAILIQLGLGLVGHRIFEKTEKSSILTKIHLSLGPTAIGLAIINGGLGIDLAMEHSARIPYGVIVAVLFIIFVIARIYLQVFNKHKPYRPDSQVIEQYKRQQSFGVSPDGAHAEVGIPEPYHDVQTPASARGLGRAFTFEMNTPVSVAPPTPSWPITPRYPDRPGMSMGRSVSGASARSGVSSLPSEHESFIGQDKAFELERRHG